MRRKRFWAPLAVWAVLLSSCGKELPPVNEPEEAPQEQEEEPGLPGIGDTSAPSLISAEIPSAIESKVSLQGSDAPGLALAWEAGDCLRIIGTGAAETFRIVEEGMTASKAGFTGKAVEGSTFTVLYPGTYDSEAAWESRSYTGQKQTGNASVSHLSWNARMTGLSSYSSLIFAPASTGTFSQNGVVKFTFNLPERFSGLERLSLTAQEAVFPTTNSAEGPKAATLSLDLEDLAFADGSRAVTAYMMVSAAPVLLAAGTEYTLTLAGPGGQVEDVVKTAPEGGLQIGGGTVTVIHLDAKDLQEPLFWGGEGTESAPYEIKTLKHLRNMNDLIAETKGASTLFFRLVDDIDMTDVTDWLYRNNDASHNWPIDFDGAGHSIVHFTMTQYSASLFGALAGCVHDLTFKDAAIQTAEASNGGLLAYRAGRKTASLDAPVVIRNVSVEGLTVTGGTASVGGLVGRLSNGTLDNCHVTGLVLTGGDSIGGLVGTVEEAPCTLTDCSVSGSITSTGKQAGGLVGYSNASGTRYDRCTFDGTVTAVSHAGGLIGYANSRCDITSCKTAGTISATTTDSIVGGLVGCAHNSSEGWGTIRYSRSNCTIKGQRRLGGLVGEARNRLSIEESAYDGSIEGGVYRCGGVIGWVNNNFAEMDVRILNCLSAGTLSASGWSGGLVGWSPGLLTLKDSYTTMAVSGSGNGMAGVAGAVGSDSAAIRASQEIACTVDGCLAWNSTFRNAGTSAQAGAIIGARAWKARSVGRCYRNAALDYSDGNASHTALSDDPDASPDAPAEKDRYDGIAAGSGVTCSAQAAALGWSTEVWNLDGVYPVLKNLAP